MFKLTTSTMIELPIQQVFDYMSTPENDFQWQYGTLATAKITSRHKEMSVYFRSIGHLMGRRNLGIHDVIESSSNMRYRFKSISGPLYMQTTYTFETAGDGTKVEVSIRIGVVNFPRMSERILGIKMKKQLKENLVMLRDILEAKRISSSSEAILLIN